MRSKFPDPRQGFRRAVRQFGVAVVVASLIASSAESAEHVPSEAPRVVDIAPAWAGHPVNFALLTRGEDQFAAFYDAERWMTLAQRKTNEDTWRLQRLPTQIGWDSHNAVTIALDRSDILHVTGNMHGVPLIYFRATRPRDIESLERVAGMTGSNEDRVTYPVFLHGPAGELIFNYRNGGAGRGDTFFNVYDERSRQWSALLEQPIFGGEGRMNAYPVGPFKGPDGYYHLTWVWRDRGGADMNHDLSYARSKDLRSWETIAGEPLTLPITLRSKGVVVDPVPVYGGIINSSGRVGFDLRNQVVIAYHKYDDRGNTQLYLARFEGEAWRHHQASDWDYRWTFIGARGGSIVFDIRHGSVTAQDDRFWIPLEHVKYGSGRWEIDPATMKLTTKSAPRDHGLPPGLNQVRSDFSGMEVRWAEDLRAGGLAARFLPSLIPHRHEPVYLLRWETLDFHGDKPRDEPWPEATMLQVVELPSSR